MIALGNYFPLLHGIPPTGYTPHYRKKGNLPGSNEEIDMIRGKDAFISQLLIPCSIVNLLI